MEDIIYIEEVEAVDPELVLSTAKSPATSLTLLKSVPVSDHCISACHYKGNTYVGMFNQDVGKIGENFNHISAFLTQNSPVFSVCVHQDKIYSLLFGRPYVVNVHNINSGELLRSWNHCDTSFSYNKLIVAGDRVIIADRLNKLLSIYNLTGEPLRHLRCPRIGSGYVALCKADCDSVIVSDSVSSRLFRVNLATGEELWSCTDIKTIPHAVTCDESQYVYVIGHLSSKIWILDIHTG